MLSSKIDSTRVAYRRLFHAYPFLEHTECDGGAADGERQAIWS
jgi:hypothetical protein